MKDWERELQEENELHPDDEALLRHVMLDDEDPPQGLHRQGYDRREKERAAERKVS